MTPEQLAARWLADVERFDLDPMPPVGTMEPDANGDWVKHADALAAIARHLAPGVRVEDPILARETEDDYALRLSRMKPTPAPVALRITGPNSDGEYWLHIKADGRTGGINLGVHHGPICKWLLDAASETGAKE